MESPLRLESWAEPGSRRSPGGALLELMLRSEPGFRRSPGGVLLQLRSGAESGSRRSPDGSYRRLMLATKPGSRRIPGGVLLELILLRTSVVDILYPTGRISYASIVGSIMYAMTCTPLDVAYSLGVVSIPI